MQVDGCFFVELSFIGRDLMDELWLISQERVTQHSGQRVLCTSAIVTLFVILR